MKRWRTIYNTLPDLMASARWNKW